MPRLGDEKEFNRGRLIKERPEEDDDRDDVAVYGSDDDDVVTGDEMDDDGNYDPEQADANLEDDDGDMSQMDFGDKDQDDLGDFEGETDPEDQGTDTGEGEDLDDVDSDADSDDLDSDDLEGDEGESKEALFDRLQDVLKSIVNFDGEGEDLDPDQMSDKELGESVRSYFLREDNYLKTVSNQFAESSDFEPTDVFKVVTALDEAKPSDGGNVSVDENALYRAQLTKYKDAKVINIIEKVTDKNSAEAEAQTYNKIWKKFKESYLTDLESPESQLQGSRPKEEEKQYLNDLVVNQGVITGSKVMEYVNESKQNPRVYVFATEEFQGESFVAKKTLREDAKSLSDKTRKTKGTGIDMLPYNFDKLLSSVLDVQFKGAMKPYTKVASEFKKANQTGGLSGQAKARRGDKRNSDPMTKVEAAKYILSVLSEMSEKQVNALIKALDGTTKPSKIVSESANMDLESDFDALKSAAEAEGLSESFIKDTQLILETAVKTRVDNAARALDVHYNTKLSKEVSKLQEAVVAQLDSYLDYVAENFMEENKLAIEEGLRTEIAESLLENIHRVFREHNVAVPEGKTNLLESKNNQVSELEEALNLEATRSMAYKRKAVKYMKEAVIAKHKTGLTSKDGNELEKRALTIAEFKDENDFESKVKDLKRMYFSENKFVKTSSMLNNSTDEEGTLLETVEDTSLNNGTNMDRYVRAYKALNQSH